MPRTRLTEAEFDALVDQLREQAGLPQQKRTAVKHLTTEELAERLGIQPRTVDNWRFTGYGPPFLPGRGNRGVRYRLADVEAWEKSCLVRPGTP